MIRPLHPTLKKCKCGFIGNRHALYKHFDTIKRVEGTLNMSQHGEVPLHIDHDILSTPL